MSWELGDAWLTGAAFTGTGGAERGPGGRALRPGEPSAGARPGVQTRPTWKVDLADPDACH